MTARKVRWGILSTANIARKNWAAIRNSGNGLVTAIASRDAKRSEQFISECQAQVPMGSAPAALGDYEELLLRRDVDAVYIPLPTGLRKEWVLKAAAAGKHIVCEKPCAPSATDLQEMVDACRAHKVQFMDGVMFMHSQRLAGIRAILDDKSAAGIGGLQRITSAFTFRAPPEFFTDNIRSNAQLEPQGCVGDLGWYCIRFALWTQKEKRPRAVTGRLLQQTRSTPKRPGIPTEFSGELFFDGGVSCGFYCSFLTHNEQLAQINGANGGIRLTDFVLPVYGNELSFDVYHPSFVVDGCVFHMEERRRRHSVLEYSDGHASSQETNLFRNFSAQILSGKLNASWPQIALNTQAVMDACLESSRLEGKIVTL